MKGESCIHRIVCTRDEHVELEEQRARPTMCVCVCEAMHVTMPTQVQPPPPPPPPERVNSLANGPEQPEKFNYKEKIDEKRNNIACKMEMKTKMRMRMRLPMERIQCNNGFEVATSNFWAENLSELIKRNLSKCFADRKRQRKPSRIRKVHTEMHVDCIHCVHGPYHAHYKCSMIFFWWVCRILHWYVIVIFFLHAVLTHA